MDDIRVYCKECGEIMGVDYTKGKFYCENCGHNVTELVKKHYEKKRS
jgi:predicted RNA-binding Zn-ribbon protein involved in translation (DUF1610 family)